MPPLKGGGWSKNHKKKEKVHPRKRKRGCPSASHKKRGGEGRGASHRLFQLLLPCGCCWLQVPWTEPPMSGTSAGIHPVIAQMGQVGFLEKGEENLASLAPGWVILGVFYTFFLIPASQKLSPFQQLSLSGSETTKQGFPGVFGSVFLAFLGMDCGQSIFCLWGVSITWSAKQSCQCCPWPAPHSKGCLGRTLWGGDITMVALLCCLALHILLSLENR